MGIDAKAAVPIPLAESRQLARRPIAEAVRQEIQNKEKQLTTPEPERWLERPAAFWGVVDSQWKDLLLSPSSS